MRKPRLSYLFRLLLTYLIALLLPLALIGQQTWNGHQKALEQEILQTNSQLLAEIASVVNLRLHELEQIAINLDINEDLRPFVLVDSPYGAVRAIRSLAQYRSTNSFIYEIGYYVRNRDYLYTSNAAYRLEQFLGVFFEQEGLSDEAMADLLENSRQPIILPSRRTTFINSQVRLITYIYPLPVGNEPYATAVFFIDEAKISDMLASIFSRRNDSIFIIDAQGRPVLTMSDGPAIDPGEVLDHLAATETDRQPAANGIYSDMIVLAGETYLVTYQPRGYRGLKYLALSPRSQVLAPALEQQRRFLVIIGSVALGGVLLILLSLFLTYKPLSRLFRKARAYQDQPDRRNNDVQLIDQVLDQMMTDNQRMRRILQTSQNDVLLACLTDLISGSIPDQEALAERATQAGLSWTGASWLALAVLIENLDPDASIPFEHLQSDPLVDCAVHVLRPSGDNAIPVLIQLDRHDLALCDACIQMIRQTASKQQLLLTIGIGTIQDDPLQVYQSWQQAVRALSYRFIAGKGTTIRYDEMEQNAHQLPWYPHQEMELLIRGISGGQEEEIRRAIDSVLEQIKQRRLGLFAARCLGYDLINTVMRVVISQNVKLDVLEAQLTDMISLPQTETIRQLGDFLVDFAIRLSEHLGQSRDTRFDRILVYLDSHFRDSDFSVTNMAADLNMSYSYLNRIFSSRSGQPVLDYLTEKRIEWIKQQLRTTEQPIKTVILSAGYNDIPNFSRKFKQREGISPRQYREQHGRPADSQN